MPSRTIFRPNSWIGEARNASALLRRRERAVMLDVVFLALGLAAFALFGGYAVLLRRL